MKTLELKHLAPYLPYGLKIYSQHESYYSDPMIWEMSEINIRIVIKYEYRKPILHPPLDLGKISVESISCTPIEFMRDKFDDPALLWGYTSDNPINRSKISYAVIEMLLEWHFDVFGLIEAGLAIDINTLKEKQQ